MGNLNLYQPEYNTKVTCSNIPTNHDINRLRYTGLYLRDRIELNDQLVLNLAGRHDWTETTTQNLVKIPKQPNLRMHLQVMPLCFTASMKSLHLM